VSYWKDLPADRIEQEYNPRNAVPDFQRHFEWREEASRKFRAHDEPPQSFRYGSRERQVIDYFALPGSRGTLFFIHGGAWRSGDRANFHYVVPTMRKIGLASSFVGYPLAPQARMTEMAQSVSVAFSRIASETTGPIYVSGHSAGAQLATTILQHHAKRNRIAGTVLISGLFDLAAVSRTSINDDLRLTETEISTFTPFNAGGWKTPTTVLVGELETAGFKDEARRIYELAPTECRDLITIESENHFSIVRQLESAASLLVGRSSSLFVGP
jgi:arylformamidase